MTNPLQKYYRQPKIYLTLPSNGKFYPPGALSGEADNVPVFGMSAMDEIVMKTPDALFSGEAVVSSIKSCIPSIVDPWKMPSLDVDVALVGIRMATYGQLLETTFKCKECNEDNKYDIDLTGILDYFSSLEYEDKVIIGPLCVHIRPLTYKETTEFAKKSYELRRRLYQTVDADTSEEEKNKVLDEAYKKLAAISIDIFRTSILKVEVDDEIVDNQQYIDEWLQNSDKELFDGLKDHVEQQKKVWSIQPQKVNCMSCGTENEVVISLDNSDFFVKR